MADQGNVDIERLPAKRDADTIEEDRERNPWWRTLRLIKALQPYSKGGHRAISSSEEGSASFNRAPTFLGSDQVWPRAFSAQDEHDYRFRAFEALHVMSIKRYERELAELAQDVYDPLGNDPPDNRLNRMRSLLTEYCKVPHTLC